MLLGLPLILSLACGRGQGAFNAPDNTPSATEETTPSPDPKASAPAGWRSHSIPELGWSFAYPADWSFDQVGRDWRLANPVFVDGYPPDGQGHGGIPDDRVKFDMGSADPDEASMEALYRRICVDPGDDGGYVQKIECKTTGINGRVWVLVYERVEPDDGHRAYGLRTLASGRQYFASVNVGAGDSRSSNLGTVLDIFNTFVIQE